MPSPARKGTVNRSLPRDQSIVVFADQAPTRDTQAWQNAGARPSSDVKVLMRDSRDRYESNPYLATLIGLKLALYLYRIRCVAQRREDTDAWVQWRDENPETVAMALRTVEFLWMDLLVVGAAVLFWREGGDGEPLAIPPEACRYSDAMGLEKLFVETGWNQSQLKGLKGISEEDARRYSKEFEVDEARGERFMVLRRSRPGFGFGKPPMVGLFPALDAFASLEVGDRLQAFLLRRVVVQWKIGHEIRTGPKAGFPTHFYKKADAEAIRAKTEGMLGVVEVVSNFDRELEFPAPNPKVFDADRYAGVIARIHQWIGPLGIMVNDPNAANVAWSLARAEAERARREMAPAISRLFDLVGCPVPVRPIFGNQCFQDSRVMAEMIRHALESGPLSQRSYLEEGGWSQDEEQERKAAEAELARTETDAGRVLPLYSRGTGRVGASGRPAGTADSGVRA